MSFSPRVSVTTFGERNSQNTSLISIDSYGDKGTEHNEIVLVSEVLSLSSDLTVPPCESLHGLNLEAMWDGGKDTGRGVIHSSNACREGPWYRPQALSPLCMKG